MSSGNLSVRPSPQLAISIVANRCLKILRGQRRHERKTKPEHRAKAAPELARLSPESERSELLIAIRQQLSTLPERNRQLVALYYGAGLTQQQIATALDMPTRTVSFKIEETVKKLQALLSRTGFAVALPLLDHNGLQEAICLGEKAPAHLWTRVLGKLEQTDWAKVGGTQKPSWLSKIIWPTAAALTMGAVLATVWIQETIQPIESPSLISTPAKMPRPHVSLYAKWDFSNGPSDDLVVYQGGWEWKKIKKKGAMVVPGAPINKATGILLPNRFQPKPFVFSIVCQVPGKGDLGLSPVWVDEQGMLPHRRWLSSVHINDQRQSIKIFVFGRYIIHALNGVTTVVYEYDRPYPGQQMIVLIRNWILFEIEVKELTNLPFDPNSEIAHLQQTPGCNLEIRPSIPKDWNRHLKR